MIRSKKQFLFLFSFQNTDYIKPAGSIKYECLSTVLFFFLPFFFYLWKYLSRRAEAYNKVHSLIYCWWNRILSVTLFLFWIHIIPIFRKGRRKNSLSCSYLWQGLIFRFLSFMGECHPPQNRLNQRLFCWLLSKDSVRLFLQGIPRSWLNWHLSFTNVCPELNFLFQISANEKDGVWSIGQSFGFFLLPPFHPVTIIEWPGFPSLFNQLQVIECG